MSSLSKVSFVRFSIRNTLSCLWQSLKALQINRTKSSDFSSSPTDFLYSSFFPCPETMRCNVLPSSKRAGECDSVSSRRRISLRPNEWSKGGRRKWAQKSVRRFRCAIEKILYCWEDSLYGWKYVEHPPITLSANIGIVHPQMGLSRCRRNSHLKRVNAMECKGKCKAVTVIETLCFYDATG